jgi:Raf kinase inhibitor-like YbhB/YbcL family protein
MMIGMLVGLPAPAHEIAGDPNHDAIPVIPETTSGRMKIIAKPSEVAAPTPSPTILQLFESLTAAIDVERRAATDAFAPFKNDGVSIRFDDRWLYVESTGLPHHPVMAGITNWQQQVPLPQPYVGNNAWQIPLHPVASKNPASIKNRFLRGAIAVAANGIPIFNPQNNRGEISAEIGELDEYGGHCGRADDYHYHAAPLHLQKIVGPDKPIAFALDGYPIYGLTEPDGSMPANLDAFNGHEAPGLGYHYHASTKYPYVNGGFHGEVIERGEQVDPQPRASAVREAGRPLRGAKITEFKILKRNAYSLTYDVAGAKYVINYQIADDGTYKFEFVDPSGAATTQTYRRGQGGRRGGDRPPPPDDQPPPRQANAVRQDNSPAKAQTGFTLRSPVVADNGPLPKEFTGDGEGATPPLEWSGAPAGTKSFALVMHHVDPEGKTKWYWVVYDIPPEVTSLPKNVKNVGTLGNNSINNRVGYAPPHSKGPGVKKYVVTIYALSEPPKIDVPPQGVSREVLLNAIKDHMLASAELNVTYDRTGVIGEQRQR